MKNLKRTPQQFKEEILNLLKQGFSPKTIAQKLNLNYVSTQQMCNRLGYTFKLNQGNIRYFEKIDTYLKAYFLGFIIADGCIVTNSTGSQTLTITIHKKDQCILDKLKEEIGCENTIKAIHTPMGFDKTRHVDHVRFTLTNKKLIADLNSWGIFPKKSMTVENIITKIPEPYKGAFIIGYFDGDGSVQLPKGNSKFVKKKNTIMYYPSYAITVSIRGTKPFLEGIWEYLDLHSTLVFNKTYILNIGNKKDVLKFFNCYKNLPFFLKRKHDKFLERINHESYKKIMQD